jgi:hypothetical protein
MSKSAFHCKLQHLAVCKYCGREFAAKQRNTTICYDPLCQNRKKLDWAKRRRDRDNNVQ